MAQSPELDHLIAAMSRYVIDLPRAIAIHLPRIKDGKVHDIEFIWGNKNFQSWRLKPLQVGDLGSATRKNFNELLPHLNTAWFDGQAIQFFVSSHKSSASDIEIETIWSKAEDVIVEWGDEIDSKIQHGSAVEAERHRRLMDAVEAERDSFVQEIHDNVLQDLHVLTMNMASKLSPSLDKDQLLSESWNLQLSLQKIQKDLRSLLTQEQQRTALLSVRLFSLGETYSNETFTTSVTIDDDTNIDTLGNDIQNELFYVCKEAVSNALKHSNGSKVDLSVGVESSTGEIQLTVQDNGDGMNDVTLRSSGTKNMEKRMNRIGGVFSLENTDGGGLRARASVSHPNQE
ncbi:MAG: hypothetical protein CL457_05870 [Acidimicrobiaceae bacterium]|nr:hypothetical protein [Acidimicrobiaceae bacterium]|tara:strand:+ start:3149 stop:4180 length:1032 start_codon:yes stop_codon:yes gene_type:complete